MRTASCMASSQAGCLTVNQQAGMRQAGKLACTFTMAVGTVPRSSSVSKALMVAEMPPSLGSATSRPGRFRARQASHCRHSRRWEQQPTRAHDIL